MACSSRTTIFILLAVLVVLLLILPSHGVTAFGAGNIPGYAYMEGRAFRHGDIEDTLSTLFKNFRGGLFGRSVRFGGLDVKRVYFGNWLRDYSQAMDIAALKKMPRQTIINLCMALGFLAHGYATAEFEVTEERLGVYLPTEHIDNPKGYGGTEDPRKYHPALRPPIDPRELEIDPETGMKNYIANENGTWDTSKSLIRRTLERCIHIGRQARASENKEVEFEAFRLLGKLLHTLEDFPAHSNFCELALISLGHEQVFAQVGDGVRIHARNGRMVAPLVTGTFGGADFIHSLLGEATDHISEASVSDLTKEMQRARSSNTGGIADSLRNMLFQVPGARNTEMAREMDGVTRMRDSGGSMNGKSPDEMSPQELHAALWQVLRFRDSVMMWIEETIERIPGLSALVTKLTNTLSVFVFTTIEPLMKPILRQATTALQLGSSEVVDSIDQYEVFDNPMASDPTHSYLSKDHFNLILNEPAGQLGKIILTHTVNLVVKAWEEPQMPTQHVTEPVLECLFHPDFHNPNSQIQGAMLSFMKQWISTHNDQGEVLRRLTKDAVRKHENVRLHTGEHDEGAGYNAGVEAQHRIGQFLTQNIPGLAQAQNMYNTVNSSYNRFTGTREMEGDLGPIPPPQGPPPDPPPSFSSPGPQPKGSPGYGPPPGPPPMSSPYHPRPPGGPPPQHGYYDQQDHQAPPGAGYGPPPGPPPFADHQGSYYGAAPGPTPFPSPGSGGLGGPGWGNQQPYQQQPYPPYQPPNQYQGYGGPGYRS